MLSSLNGVLLNILLGFEIQIYPNVWVEVHLRGNHIIKQSNFDETFWLLCLKL